MGGVVFVVTSGFGSCYVLVDLCNVTGNAIFDNTYTIVTNHAKSYVQCHGVDSCAPCVGDAGTA